MDQAVIASRVRWRLALPCILFMLMSSLDRANISFAAQAMNADLGFTPSQYGFGAGVLFVGFLLGQYPSLWWLQRVGMPAWIATCALVWGLAAGSLGFIEGHTQFYLLRVVIGVAEGGLAPGIVLYLSQFATERERATTFTMPALAIPASVIIGAPLSGWLLGLDHGLPIANWRFMFIAEAIPTICLGLFALFYFPPTPARASFLTGEQRSWLMANAARRADAPRRNDWTVLRQPIVVLAGLLWFCLLCGSYGVIFWLPQVIGALTGLGPLAIGIVGSLPWVGVACGMYWNARHSDRTGERYWHVAVPALGAALLLLLAWALGPVPVTMGVLLLAGFGLGSAQGGFWAIPTQLLGAAGFSVAVVGINILGSAGGFVMPQLMGIARESSGGFALPTLLVVLVLLCAVVLVGAIRWIYRRELAALASRSTQA
ncbi:MAG TPA: MFS transporter [Steroidobacteraceae bacterium]|nr:MFS transporter [Steroidobacteraceae bacterium]